MTKEEKPAHVRNGCHVLTKTLLLVLLSPLLLVLMGMLWKKWDRPPQSWFLTNRRMTDLSVEISLLMERSQELPVPVRQ